MDYLRFVFEESRIRHEAGLSVWDAARDIRLGRFASLGERGRLVVNVLAVYRELEPGVDMSLPEVFTRMGSLEDLLSR